jgi:cytochrome bd-type quinol oxidase subunit 2
MNSFLTFLIVLGIIVLIFYTIKKYFDFKISQGKETSNAPIRMAIGSLVVAFLAIVGFAPIVAGIIIQLLNNLPGINLEETQNSEVIGAILFVFLCLTIAALIYFYYSKRNRLYFENQEKGENPEGTQDTFSKNVVKNSNINVKGDFQIGDSTTIKKN